MKQLYLIILTFQTIVLLDCKLKNENPLLEEALVHANKNRPELERVLEYFKHDKKDSLKLKAAIYLISNMEDKFSYQGVGYSYFLRFIDSLSGTTNSVEQTKAILRNYRANYGSLTGVITKKQDLEYINADYLISNINQSFLVYETLPWCKSLSFDDFCEYILPYRIGSEPLEEYRSKYYNKYSYLQFNKSLGIQAVADSILARLSPNSMELITFPDSIPDFQPSILERLKGGACRESSDLGIFVFRSMGIPVGDDFTPQWADRAFSHSWCSLLLNNDSLIDFQGATSEKIGGHLAQYKNRLAKVFRNTYSKQASSLAMQHGSEPVPELFSNPCIKDVSRSYFKGVDIQLDLNTDKIKNKKFAYLCVFNNKDFTPVQWGEIINSKVIFPAMGKSVIYLPAIYCNDSLQIISDPILLDSMGSVKYLIPDEQKIEKVILKRKYPVLQWWVVRLAALVNGYFEAANRSDFSDTKRQYTITKSDEMTYQTVNLNSDRKYKYWRYVSADSSYGKIAEIELYDDHHKLVRGKVIGTDSTRETQNGKEGVFDGNTLTFFEGDYPNGNWVGLELDKPTTISKIRYLSWNDDNFIREGEDYELFYFKNFKWQSLGKRLGDSTQALLYDNVPSNSLLLLRNFTKGKEERIFTYNNGRQIWW